MIEKFSIYCFLEKEKKRLTFIPLVIENEIYFEFVVPGYVVDGLEPTVIGEQVLFIASFIKGLADAKTEIELIGPKKLPIHLGYSSWAKVKKSTNLIVIHGRNDEEGSQIVEVFPYFPYGKGFGYGLEDNSLVKVVSARKEDIGHAILDVISEL